MKITVRYKDAEIIVCENENDTKDGVASMRWSDQNKQIQETIIVMTEQVKKLSDKPFK